MMDFKNFKEMFGSSRIKELEDQLAKNNPILEEAADYIDALEAKVAELEAKLEKYENLEPVAWEVYVAEFQNSYVVDSLDDGQLVDDATNHNAEITPLYALEK